MCSTLYLIAFVTVATRVHHGLLAMSNASFVKSVFIRVDTVFTW